MNTNENCEYEKDLKLRKCLYDWFNEYEWKWFVSLNLPYNDIENTEKYLKKWIRNLSTRNHIQICYMGVLINSTITGNHIHLLMNDNNKNENTLLDMDKNEWGELTHKKCDIQLVRDDGVIDYIINKNTPHGHFQLITPYNKKLLEKYKKLN